MNIKENIEKLEEIVNKLDSNDIELEKSISLFEEAVKIVKESYTFLNEANGKITVLKEELNGLVEKDFSIEE